VADNDPSLSTIDFSDRTTFTNEHAIKLAIALAGNTHVTAVHLRNCSILDSGAKALGEALTTNKSIRLLDLEGNKIKNDGIEAIATGIANNTTLKELVLFKNSDPGNSACAAFIKTFETNVFLLKINWRITSRQSFAINKCLTRNNEILRRLKAGRAFDDQLPDGVDGDEVKLALAASLAAGDTSTPGSSVNGGHSGMSRSLSAKKRKSKAAAN